MPTATINDLMEEVKSLHADLVRRVDESDIEQKKRGEDLTSKNATMAAEFKQVADRINNRMNEIDDKITELDREQKQAQIATNRPPWQLSKKDRSEHHKIWLKAIKLHMKDGAGLTTEEKAFVMPAYMPAERKALYAGDATTGGYFAATDFLDELLAYRLLISPMRKICRKQPTSGEKIQMPSLQNDTTVFWTSEQAAYQNSQDPTVNMVEIPVHEMRALLKISEQNLEDSQFNLEDLLKQRMMLNFAKLEGQAFITGNGQGKPRGLMSYPTAATTSFSGGSAGKNNGITQIPYVLSGAATGKLNADDVLNVKMDLKADYDANASYVFTRGTLNSIRLLKDAMSRPLWQPFAGANLPSLVYDSPYIEMPDMQELGTSGNFVIACGDFSYYMIVDRISLAIRELDELYAASGLVGFIARMRVGGDVLLPEAFRLLKIN